MTITTGETTRNEKTGRPTVTMATVSMTIPNVDEKVKQALISLSHQLNITIAELFTLLLDVYLKHSKLEIHSPQSASAEASPSTTQNDSDSQLIEVESEFIDCDSANIEIIPTKIEPEDDPNCGMAFNMDQVVVKTEITDSENNFTCGGDQGESLMINAEVDDDVGAQRERHHDTQGNREAPLNLIGNVGQGLSHEESSNGTQRRMNMKSAHHNNDAVSIRGNIGAKGNTRSDKGNASQQMKPYQGKHLEKPASSLGKESSMSSTNTHPTNTDLLYKIDELLERQKQMYSSMQKHMPSMSSHWEDFVPSVSSHREELVQSVSSPREECVPSVSSPREELVPSPPLNMEVDPVLVRELFSAPPSTTQSTTPTCCIAPQSPQHPHSSTRRPPPHPKSTLRSSQPRRSLTSTSPQRSQSAVTRSSQRNSTIQNNKKTIADIVNKKYEYFNSFVLKMALRRDEPRKVVNELIRSVYTKEQQMSYSVTGGVGMGADGTQMKKKQLPDVFLEELHDIMRLRFPFVNEADVRGFIRIKLRNSVKRPWRNGNNTSELHANENQMNPSTGEEETPSQQPVNPDGGEDTSQQPPNLDGGNRTSQQPLNPRRDEDSTNVDPVLVRELFSAPPSTTQSTTATCCIARESPLRESPQPPKSTGGRSPQPNSATTNVEKSVAEILKKKYQHFDRLALSMSLHHMRGNSPSKVVNELLNSVYSPEQQASYSLMGALGLRGDGIQLRKKRLPVTLYTEILDIMRLRFPALHQSAVRLFIRTKLNNSSKQQLKYTNRT